ncbi:MAG TPA: hypothetical protein VGL23_13500 [Chloroflexota bacterium]|jgi:hypothetical protein
MTIDEREFALMRWLGGQGDGSALWNDVVDQFRDDGELAEHLAALDARGLVEVLDPFGTEKRVVLTQKGVLCLLADRTPRTDHRQAATE